MTDPAEENDPTQIGSINFENISGSQIELGDVNIQVQAGDIVGRDKIINIYQTAAPQRVEDGILANAQKQLAQMPLDILPPVASLPTGSRLPFPRNPLFVGRTQDLLNLAKALKAGETAAIGQVAAATGLGGIGKTQLAIEFAHRYGHYFQGGVFWLNFAEAQTIALEVAACGGRAYLNLAPDFEQLELAAQVQLVLSAWQSELPRLLIFDNCEAEALLRQWRPPSGGCRVLITSRRAGWSRILNVQALPLDVLARADSMALLLKHRPDLAGPPPAPPARGGEGGGVEFLDAIAGELGDLPLALHLAGSYLETFQDSPVFGDPARFLAELGDARILNHPALQGEDVTLSGTNHSLHVGRTFALSYDQLKPTDPVDRLAQQLLARAACFAPGEAVPRTLLLAMPPRPAAGSLVRRIGHRLLNLVSARPAQPEADPGAVRQAERALNRLLNLGLLTPTGTASSPSPLPSAPLPPSSPALLLHRLLAHFVRQVAVDAAEAQAAVETAILQAVSERQDQAGHLADMLPLQAHLRFVTDAALDREDEQAARLGNWLGYYLQQIGDYAAARPYYGRALAIYEQVLGPAHPDTAAGLNNLALLLKTQGDYAAARPYYERALVIREKVLGPEHPDTAAGLNNLAGLLYAQGDYAAARPLFERALAIYEKALGPAHPDTARGLDNLASVLYAQGDYTAARPYYERALAIYEKVLGPAHPDTATSLNNLAALLKAQGDYAAAWPYYKQALAIREKALGPAHPDTARSLNNLAGLLQEQGDIAAARPLFERALAIREKALGPAHPDTALSLSNLAGVLYAQGDYAAARPYFERALAIREKALGPAHPDTALSLSNLAMLLQAQGDTAAARPYYEWALAIREKVLGPAHPHTALSLNNLALLFQAQGDYAAARAYFERTLAIFEARLGPDHPHTRIVRGNLAGLGREEEAEEQRSKGAGEQGGGPADG